MKKMHGSSSDGISEKCISHRLPSALKGKCHKVVQNLIFLVENPIIALQVDCAGTIQLNGTELRHCILFI